MQTRSGRVHNENSAPFQYTTKSVKGGAQRKAFGNLGNQKSRPGQQKSGHQAVQKQARGLGKPSRTLQAPTRVPEVKVDINLDDIELEADEQGPMNMSLDESVELLDVTLENIDEYDEEDPQCVTDFVNDIYDFLRYKEEKFPLNHHYIAEVQNDINAKMRFILLDWLSDVGLKFRLLNDTTHMTVLLVDRFLSCKSVSRRKLQLIGVTAMLIASKYEEIYAPEVHDFVYICDNAYTREQILEMERLMLNTLNFDICHPTPLHFLRRFSKAARSDSEGHTLSKYLLELSLVSYPMLKWKPSQMAAAAVYVGRKMMIDGFYWGSTLKHYTGYREADFIDCAREMNELVKKEQAAEKKSAVYRKYSKRFMGVAKIPAVDI